MVYTIRPPGRWPRGPSIVGGLIKASMFFVAAAIGALSVTLAAAFLGRWIALGQMFTGVPALAGVGVFLVSIDLNLSRFRLPSRNHQVSRRTIMRHGWVGTLPYGFALGTGFWTWMNVSLPYLLVFAIFLSGDFRLALVAALGFAAGRALPIAVGAFVVDLSTGGLSQRIERWEHGRAQWVSAVLVIGLTVRIIAA